jgi:hypothetical protein
LVEAGVCCRDGRWRIYLRSGGDAIHSRQEFSSRADALRHLVEVTSGA